MKGRMRKHSPQQFHTFFLPSQLLRGWTGLLGVKNCQYQTTFDMKHGYVRNNTRHGFHFPSSFPFGCFWADRISQEWNQSKVWLLKNGESIEDPLQSKHLCCRSGKPKRTDAERRAFRSDGNYGCFQRETRFSPFVLCLWLTSRPHCLIIYLNTSLQFRNNGFLLVIDSIRRPWGSSGDAFKSDSLLPHLPPIILSSSTCRQPAT